MSQTVHLSIEHPQLRGKVKKIEINMEAGGWVQVSLGVREKKLENRPKIVLYY